MTSNPLYDRIGTGYDTTRQPDPSIAGRLAHHLGGGRGGRYLDLGCGTGNYTRVLAAAGGDWVGLDISGVVLGAARQKRAPVRWVRGDAAALPFADDHFSGATCVVALHHMADLTGSLHELGRVLAPGARFVAFTSTPEQMQGYWIGEYFPTALARSVEQMPSLAVVETALEAAGLHVTARDSWDVPPDLRDRFLYSGKHYPERYLDPGFRSGISTFADLADEDEVGSGCTRLEADISSGRIDDVRLSYRHDHGDYLFLVSTRHP